MKRDIKVGQPIQLYDANTGNPCSKGLVDAVDFGVVWVTLESGEYVAWNINYVSKLREI